MKECEECGKTLGIFRGYKHPTMGKKQSLCSPCFDDISSSVKEWQTFILTNGIDNPFSYEKKENGIYVGVPAPA